MSTVTINGKTITVPDGSDLSVINNTIFVNGKKWDGGDLSGIVKVELSGDIKSVKTDASLTVNGDVNGSANSGGSMMCGNITGNANSGGSMQCGHVGGNVCAGGAVSHS